LGLRGKTSGQNTWRSQRSKSSEDRIIVVARKKGKEGGGGLGGSLLEGGGEGDTYLYCQTFKYRKSIKFRQISPRRSREKKGEEGSQLYFAKRIAGTAFYKLACMPAGREFGPT